MSRITWDQTLARQLLEEGQLTNHQIAKRVGTSYAALTSWMARNNLARNHAPAKPPVEAVEAPPAPGAQEPVQEPAPAPAPTELLGKAPAAPLASSEPVAISFSYNGSAVTLTASNLAGAAWACRYLQQLLTNLEEAVRNA